MGQSKLKRNVPMKDAPTTPKWEGSASNMGQSAKHAVMKGAPTTVSNEVSALGMEQREELAVTEDAPTIASEEESVLGMEQKLRTKHAVMRDALNWLRREGCVSDMGQRNQLAIMLDVPTMPGKEESALDMEHTLLLKRNAAKKDAPTKPRREVSVIDTE